jgi:hypothetical protein
MLLPIVLFVLVLIICACSLTLLVFDALEGEKMIRLEQQSDGQIKEKCENDRHKKTKKIDITKYVLKTRLRPDKKCHEINELIPKTKVPSCKTCPDMDGFIRKTEVPSCPAPPDMSNYIHKNDIPKKESKSFWHHLTGMAHMFKKHFKKHFMKHFMKHYPKPIKVEHPPQESKTPEPEPIPENIPESEPIPENIPESEPEPEPIPENIRESVPEPDYYGNETNHMSLFAGEDILRPANSFTCNGYSQQRTDTCYYY